jgi:hypothetical protein
MPAARANETSLLDKLLPQNTPQENRGFTSSAYDHIRASLNQCSRTSTVLIRITHAVCRHIVDQHR